MDAASHGADKTSELEARLLEAFRRHVRPNMTADDDFFEADGVSLTAAVCVAESRKSGIPVNLRELFRLKCARQLATTLALPA